MRLKKTIELFMPSRVPTHRPPGYDPRANARQYDQARAEDKGFYSRAQWRKVRAFKLAISPLCEQCEAKGVVTPAEHVHHRKPRHAFPELAYEVSNLESLCLPCHNTQDVR
jgi:5-methylcytosine-specific restriction enzyme A